MKSLILAPVAALVASGSSVRARTSPLEARGPQLAPPLFAGLTWRSLGPPIFGGRILDIEVARAAGQPDQIYILPRTAASSRAAITAHRGRRCSIT
jgi:hypothetical protein